jgi:cobalt-zinc-cadmium efflux system outer membrane protein
LQAGDVARADAHQAQASVAAAAGELAESMRVLVAAQESVRALTGLVLPDAEPDLDRDASTSLAGNRREPLPALPAQAEGFAASHPAVADLSAQADVARRTLDLARTQTRAHPEVVVAATRERGEFGEPHRDTVTLGIRIPLGADARYRARVASASAEALELEGRMRLERERIVAAVAAARRHVDLSKMRLDAALERERLARETRGFHQRSFSAGETDLPTRLRIELDAAEAARQAGRARIDHAHAVSSLRQALGLLPE